MTNFKFQPIIIIGAARSGTNMLRDVLTSLDDFATWPCDEINYIWRYGNKKREDDEFDITNVNFKSKKYIRKQFKKIKRWSSSNIRFIRCSCKNERKATYTKNTINKRIQG